MRGPMYSWNWRCRSPAHLIGHCEDFRLAKAVMRCHNGRAAQPWSYACLNMKLCPQCETGYHDQLTSCPTHGGVLSEIRELKPGMLIHKTYRIVRKLGQGGMGTVYLADHLLMEEQRALKFLSAELSQDAAFTGRFRREVRTLRQVRHKNVVDCGDLESAEDDSLFFAMEFVNGPDLRSFLRKAPQPFDVEMALAITEGIAEGLGAAHAQGMVHRDIKPENILMTRVAEVWVPKIADFGIVATKETSHYTQTGSSLLTPFYAAPEQWRGTRAAELDGRTDIYALGGMLFEMLTGERVFKAENYEGWAYQHQQTAPRTPSSVRPELAEWRGLDALVVRMLAKEPGDRPSDVAEVLSLLSAVQYVPTVSRRTVTLQPPPVDVAATKGSRRMPGWAWAIGAVVLVAAAFAAGRIFGPQPATPTPNASPKALPAVNTEAQSSTIPPNPAAEATSVPQPSKEKPPSGMKPSGEKAIPERQTKPGTADHSQPVVPKLDPIQIRDKAEALYADKRFVEAAELFKQACEGGNAASCNHLGFMYRSGEGVAQDYSRAYALFSGACNAGSTGGCDNLGILYDKGWGVAQDSSRAAAIFLKACDSGGGNACTNLGILNLDGRGVERNPAKGKEFLNRGCSLGDSRGCNRLGRLK
jgi:serine/threonine protein kinase